MRSGIGICKVIGGFIFMLSMIPSKAPGQQQTRVLSDPTCHACSVELHRAVLIGDEDGPGGLSVAGWVQRNSEGHYLVTQKDVILVFDSDGSYRATIGRAGNGPGEYRSIQGIQVGEGDTLHVFDKRTLRHTVLGPSYQYVRSERLPGRFSAAAVLLPDRVVLNEIINSPSALGLPLHYVSDGRRTLSFGDTDPLVRRDVVLGQHRALSPSPEGNVWASHVAQYLVEEWDPAGTRLTGLVREVSWFERDQPQEMFGERGVPTMVRAVHADVTGHVWVIIALSDDDWREGVATGAHPDGPDHFVLVDEDRFYDSTIEVIDPRTASVLASRRFDEAILGFVNDEQVYGYRTNEEGIPHMVIWDLSLKERH